MSCELDSKNIVEIKTVQSSAFRILVEALKEILVDANLECDETGIKMIAMDSSRTVLVHLKLHADKFESYVIVDDLLATGGTVKCIEEIVKACKKEIKLLSVFIELKELKGRNKFDFEIESQVTF